MRRQEWNAKRNSKKFPEIASKHLESRDPEDSRPVVIMAQDEGRFGRISDPRRCWAPPGIRPIAPRQVIREYLYAYAAVCPALGKMTSLILPYANTEMMNIFLKQTSDDFNNYFVLMLVDQAGWHKSLELKVPENIRLIEQPSHSPELNPAEHLWEDLRENEFHNKAFGSLDQVEQALCDGLRRIEADPDVLRSMTRFPYLHITL